MAREILGPTLAGHILPLVTYWVESQHFLFKVFSVWTVFEVFIEFVTVLLLFYVSFFLACGIHDLGSHPLHWKAFLKILLIYFWLCWIFIAVHGV